MMKRVVLYWCRDVLSVNGSTLTILRDLESGGGSTTRTITYTKTL